MKWTFTTVFRMATRRWSPCSALLIMHACVAMVSFSGAVWAQTDSLRSEPIAVVARPSKDSIVLRWSPHTYDTWQRGNTHGYRIERFVIARKGRVLQNPERAVLAARITPLPEERWTDLVTQNSYAAIAAQALFGDRFEIDLSQRDVFSIVNKVKENEQRFSFALFAADMSSDAARASGMLFADHDVVEGDKYLYRVMLEEAPDEFGSVYAGPSDSFVLPPPLNLRVAFTNHAVSLRWTRPLLCPYTAFLVERSHDGKSFNRVSETPLVTLAPLSGAVGPYEFASDSLPDYTVTYYYRVKGITPFGEEGPPSNVVHGRGTPEVDNVPYIVSAENVSNSAVRLTWDFPEESNTAIKSFRIERALSPDAAFKEINAEPVPSGNREFLDTSPALTNYYRICALGKNGMTYPSHVYFAQLIDSIPPSPPAGLQAIIGDEGDVALSWTQGTEKDLYGYRVYRSWHLSEEPSQLTDAPITANIFKQQLDLESLNEVVYYSVMAIDVNQNHSRLSDPLRVTLPDKVRPLAPMITPSALDTAGITISWIPGGSEDIVAYKVYRQAAGETEWLQVHAVESGRDSIYHFKDDGCEPGEQVFYTVLSVDDAGLESLPAGVVSRVCGPRDYLKPVAWRRANIRRDENTVALSWSSEIPGVTSFRIYRSVNSGLPILWKSVNGSERELSDNIVPGNSYSYRILACLENGRMSSMSEEIRLKY